VGAGPVGDVDDHGFVPGPRRRGDQGATTNNFVIRMRRENNRRSAPQNLIQIATGQRTDRAKNLTDRPQDTNPSDVGVGVSAK
jgi:hypothetical protein